MSDEVRITNREIYDLVQEVKVKLTETMASTEVRLSHLEDRAARPWHVWLAVVGPLVSLPVALWAATKGAS